MSALVITPKKISVFLLCRRQGRAALGVGLGVIAESYGRGGGWASGVHRLAVFLSRLPGGPSQLVLRSSPAAGGDFNTSVQVGGVSSLMMSPKSFGDNTWEDV